MAHSALEIANKLLHRAWMDESSELLSNMKLQKLLYYQQGFHLAYFGTPLFDEDIVAWQYGPVIPVVYDKYKEFGRAGIEPQGEPLSLDSEKEENLFNEVFEVYNQFSAAGLVTQTHSESPWVETPKQGVISQELMRTFFLQRLV